MSTENNRKLFPLIFSVSIALAVSFSPLSAQSEGEEIELVKEMGALQNFMHKTGLSLRAGNMEAASFYIHEIDEPLENVMKVEMYDGFPISALAKAMLAPMFEKLEDAVKSGDPAAISEIYGLVIKSCNACHTVTNPHFSYLS